MATATSTLQAAEQDGVTFSIPPLGVSGIKTLWPNVTVFISVAQVIPVTGGTVPSGVTVTFGLAGGKKPSTPSATVGFNIPPNTIQPFYLGANRDSMNFFNLDTTNSATVSIQGMAV